MGRRCEGDLTAADARVLRTSPRVLDRRLDARADGLCAHVHKTTLEVIGRDSSVCRSRSEVLGHHQCKEWAHCWEAGADNPYVDFDGGKRGLIGVVKCAVVRVREVV